MSVTAVCGWAAETVISGLHCSCGNVWECVGGIMERVRRV